MAGACTTHASGSLPRPTPRLTGALSQQDSTLRGLLRWAGLPSRAAFTASTAIMSPPTARSPRWHPFQNQKLQQLLAASVSVLRPTSQSAVRTTPDAARSRIAPSATSALIAKVSTAVATARKTPRRSALARRVPRSQTESSVIPPNRTCAAWSHAWVLLSVPPPFFSCVCRS